MAAERKEKRTYSLKVLHRLMTAAKPVTTNEIKEMLGCDRKTVYQIIANLEISGFAVGIAKLENGHNAYFYKGIYGRSED